MRCFRLLLLCCCSLLLCEPAASSHRYPADVRTASRFSGSVVDSVTGQPLIGASVMIVEAKLGDLTRVDGSFEFSKSVEEGVYTVRVRYIGYEEKVFALRLIGSVRMRIALAPAAVVLPEVTVTGRSDRARERGSAQAVAIMSPEELDRHRGQTLGESLRNIPGVTVLQTGPSISKPVIRGLHSQRVRVINAGIAQEGQQWGGEHAPEIDPFSADRIEVLKGASGVEYGAGAIGGVIRIEPRSLRYTPGFGGKLTINGFENNRQGAASLLVEDNYTQLPGFAWRLQGSVRRAGDANAPEYGIGNSGFLELDGTAAAGFEQGPVRIEGFYTRFQTELGIYRGSHVGNYDDLIRAITTGRPPTAYPFTYDIIAPKQEVSHDTWSALANWKIPGAGRLHTQVGWQVNHRQEYDAHRRWFDTTEAGSRPAFDLRLVSGTIDIKFRHEPMYGFFGTIGVSGVRQTNVGNSLSFLVPNFRSQSAGVYAVESWIEGGFHVEAGARLDAYTTRVYAYDAKDIPDTELRYLNVSGTFGLQYEMSPSWSIGANAGSAWRPPGVSELYSNGVHHGTAQYEIGNPALTRERSISLDATAKHYGEHSRLEVSIYQSWFAGFISLLPEAQPTLTLRGLFPTFRYVQADAVLRGIEGMLEQEFLHVFSAGISFSIVRGKRSRDNDPLYQMPADRGRVWIHVHLPDAGFVEDPDVQVGVQAVAEQTRVPSTSDYLAAPAGYLLVDAECGGAITVAGARVRINASVRNVFNVSYRDYLSRFRYFVDNPGRDIVLRLQIPFGSTY